MIPGHQVVGHVAARGMLTLAEAAELRIFRGDTTPAEACRAVIHPNLAALAASTDSVPL